MIVNAGLAEPTAFYCIMTMTVLLGMNGRRLGRCHLAYDTRCSTWSMTWKQLITQLPYRVMKCSKRSCFVVVDVIVIVIFLYLMTHREINFFFHLIHLLSICLVIFLVLYEELLQHLYNVYKNDYKNNVERVLVEWYLLLAISNFVYSQ